MQIISNTVIFNLDRVYLEGISSYQCNNFYIFSTLLALQGSAKVLVIVSALKETTFCLRRNIYVQDIVSSIKQCVFGDSIGLTIELKEFRKSEKPMRL